MIRLLLAVAIIAALVAYWLTDAHTAIDYDTDVNDSGKTDAIDIAIVRSRFNVAEPTVTPIPGGYQCQRSYQAPNSYLTGSGWPQEYDGAEVRWLGAFGEDFSTLTVDASGNASASVVGQASFAGVVGIDGQPYAGAC